ncbi:hypothetical protein [Brevundimonas goettingensis]|uniref:Uncharacterized protein n=1 Tax=Brevundimonas goettingensis TaxID=2774190 RepID=A0A975GVQ1_9CAUL|nr:hypothetical protein [Brevundimonas goettingensis]QTC91677.1 hypothetical protein IFJ75_01700 [Brevundimonas goettingensis]
MPADRKGRPRRVRYNPADDPYFDCPWDDEFLQACARFEVMKAFKNACHKMVWATARARGVHMCGEAEFAEAEAMVIASGHPKPPADWFLWNPIFDTDRPNPFGSRKLGPNE